MLLADELLLLAIAAENEGWGVEPDGRPIVDPGLTVAAAVAVLADLALLGRVVPGREVVGVESTGDADLDAALGVVATEEQAMAAWVRAVAGARPDLARLDRLRADRVLTEYESVAARPARRLFSPEIGVEVPILDRARQAMKRGAADERTTALLALLRATGLHGLWFREMSTEELDRRLAAVIPADDWIGDAVATGIPSS